jgi:hypothetical protein
MYFTMSAASTTWSPHGFDVDDTFKRDRAEELLG